MESLIKNFESAIEQADPQGVADHAQALLTQEVSSDGSNQKAFCRWLNLASQSGPEIPSDTFASWGNQPVPLVLHLARAFAALSLKTGLDVVCDDLARSINSWGFDGATEEQDLSVALQLPDDEPDHSAQTYLVSAHAMARVIASQMGRYEEQTDPKRRMLCELIFVISGRYAFTQETAIQLKSIRSSIQNNPSIWSKLGVLREVVMDMMTVGTGVPDLIESIKSAVECPADYATQGVWQIAHPGDLTTQRMSPLRPVIMGELARNIDGANHNTLHRIVEQLVVPFFNTRKYPISESEYGHISTVFSFSPAPSYSQSPYLAVLLAETNLVDQALELSELTLYEAPLAAYKVLNIAKARGHHTKVTKLATEWSQKLHGMRPFDDLFGSINGELRKDSGQKTHGHWALADTSMVFDGDHIDVTDLSLQELFEIGALEHSLHNEGDGFLGSLSAHGVALTASPEQDGTILSGLLARRILRINVEAPHDSLLLDRNEGKVHFTPDAVSWIPALKIRGTTRPAQVLNSVPEVVRERIAMAKPSECLEIWHTLAISDITTYWSRISEERGDLLGREEHPQAPSISVIRDAIGQCSLRQCLLAVHNVVTAHGSDEGIDDAFNWQIESISKAETDPGPEIREPYLPVAHGVRYFFEVFLPFGQQTYEATTPNIEAIQTAQQRLRESPSPPKR